MRYLLIILIVFSTGLFAQKSLQIVIARPGKVKTFDIYAGDVLRYKLKGDLFFRKHVISAVGDSMLVFTNDSAVKLSAIKVIHYKHVPLLAVFGKILIAGFLFLPLNTLNNATAGRTPVLSEKAAYIAGASVVAGAILYELSFKRIRVGKRKSLHVIETNYQNIGTKKEPKGS